MAAPIDASLPGESSETAFAIQDMNLAVVATFVSSCQELDGVLGGSACLE